MGFTAVPTVAVGQLLHATDWNSYVRDNLNYLVDSSGRLQPTANDHYFGAYAQGAAGQRLHVQSNSGATAVVLQAESSGLYSDMYVQTYGTGTLYLGTNTSTYGSIGSTGNLALAGTDHYFGANARGGAGQRLHINSNAGAVAMTIATEASTSYADLYIQTKGSATTYFQTDGGATTQGWWAHSGDLILANNSTGISIVNGKRVLYKDATAVYLGDIDNAAVATIVRAGGSDVLKFDTARHLVSQGTAPTVNAYDSTVFSSATISGNDTAGTITLTVKTSPASIAANTQMVVINYATAYSATPTVLVSAKTNTNAINTQPWATAISTSSFDITATKTYSPGAGVVLTFAYFVIG